MNGEIDMLGKKFTELYYRQEDKNIQLPDWGYFFIELGVFSSHFIQGNSRLIIALTVPIRSFCSPLITYGYVCNKWQNFPKKNYLEYAEYLKTLPLGTPILLHSEVGRNFKGLLKGYKVIDNILYFAVEYEQSSTRYVKINESRRIEVIQSNVVLPKNQKGRAESPTSDFCLAILGSEYTPLQYIESNLEAVIIGPKNKIEAEVMNQEFTVSRGQVGTLQDILRIKEFQSDTKFYRSRIISDRIKLTKIQSGVEDSPLVVFDGAQGFLKWRNYWRESAWVVVLERTEYQFDSAVEQINREFTLRGKENNYIELVNLEVPVGIELMIFSE